MEIKRLNRLKVGDLLCVVFLFCFASSIAQSGQEAISVNKSVWKGFERYNLKFENRDTSVSGRHY